MKLSEKIWKYGGEIGKLSDRNWGDGVSPEKNRVISGDFCSFLEEKKAGKWQVIAKKCMKKDLMQLVLVSYTRSYFSNF